jgi:hypothetical protein
VSDDLCPRWLEGTTVSWRCRRGKGHPGAHNAGTGVTCEVAEMERLPVAGSWSTPYVGTAIDRHEQEGPAPP